MIPGINLASPWKLVDLIDDEFIERLAIMTRLQKLKVSEQLLPHLTFYHLSKLTSLKELEVNNQNNNFLTNEQAFNITRCTNIQNLRATGFPGSEIFTLNNLPFLHTLRIRYVGDNLQHIGIYCDALENLELRNDSLGGHIFPSLNLTHFSYLNAITNLKNLDLNLSPGCFITLSELHTLRRTLSKLTSLVIDVPITVEAFDQKE